MGRWCVPPGLSQMARAQAQAPWMEGSFEMERDGPRAGQARRTLYSTYTHEMGLRPRAQVLRYSDSYSYAYE